MIKEKNDKGELILFEEIYFIEGNDAPNRIIGRLRKEDIGKLFKSQELVAVIEGLGNENNEDIVNIPEGTEIKIIIKVLEKNEEE